MRVRLHRTVVAWWTVVAALWFVACSPVGHAHDAAGFQSLFNAYQAHFISPDGRVIDRAYQDQRTTSEAQAYAMFFALVANDRPLFSRLLAWTERNLAQGNLAQYLPAWLWGMSRNGHWQVLDGNSAADADLWMAYTLIQAGRLWRRQRYTLLGARLAQEITEHEIVRIKKWGPMLQPGSYGFGPTHRGCYVFNPSYMPLPLYVALGARFGTPWTLMARGLSAFLTAASPRGVAPNWTEWCPATGFRPDPSDGPYGSYAAIRVYLWAGITNPKTRGARSIMRALGGMKRLLKTQSYPPISVNTTTGVTQGRGPVGFSAALWPYLKRAGAAMRSAHELATVRADRQPDGLYGRTARYYDQNLTLFALAYREDAFHFRPNGSLEVSWQ